MRIKTADFNLEATLESGQVFGFCKDSAGTFEGSIGGAPVRLRQANGHLVVESDKKSNLSEDSVRAYFDLDRDLGQVYRVLSDDAKLRPFYLRFKGLRIIRQDPWEALACFIISANNNVKRIQGIRRNLALAFSDSSFLFPKAVHIAQTSERRLRQLGLGYRAPFLLSVAQCVADEPAILERIQKSDYEEAKTRLMNFPGVGEKVADCVLLFGFQRFEAFPVDTWIWRVMRKLYFSNRKITERKASSYARRRWGSCAGYVQQYLYHGARSGILGAA